MNIFKNKKTKNEGIEPFYIDESRMVDFKRDHDPVKFKGQSALNVLAQTKITVDNWQEFQDFCKNGIQFYKKKYAQTHLLPKLNEVFPGIALNMEENVEPTEEAVIAAGLAKKVDRYLDSVNPILYKVENNTIEFSEKYFETIAERFYFFAVTEEQIERLTYCNELIEVFKKIEKQIEREWQPTSLATKLIDEKAYLSHALPYCLRIQWNKLGTKCEIVPNHAFVCNGFFNYSIPGFGLIPDPKAQRKHIKHYGQEYIRIRRVFGDGATGFLMVPKGEEDKYRMNAWRMGKTEELPGTFNERGEPFHENPINTEDL